MGRPPKKKGASAGQAAQGGGPHKRTPQSAFDPAAGKDIYEPERIVAERMAKGATQYQVKWKNYDTKSNTWEPLEHLAGCEDMIADFKEREKQRHAELDAAASAKRVAAQEAAAKKAADDSAAAAAARVAARAAGSPAPAEEQCPPCGEDGEDDSKKEKSTRRSSPIWTAFDQMGCDKDHAACKLSKDNGENCGEVVSVKAGPSVMWNHTMYKHKADFIRLKGTGVPLELDGQSKLPAVSAKHRDAIHRATARWLVKRKRALSLPEDPEFHDVWKIAMMGSYTPPDHKIVLSNVLQLSGEGMQKVVAKNTALRAEGIKPAMAGDIWGDRGVSLLGICEYYMTDNWEIEELVVAAKPFSERHTAEAIERKTSEACVQAGLSADVHSSVFFPISDNGANMVAGWASFGRGPCAVHTGQLSVMVFLNHSEIKPTRDKEHGITTHFSRSTGVDGLGALQRCQRECSLPEHAPVKDNDTRWSSGHDQMDWFRVQQRAIQLYDVNHARKAGDAYKEHQMGLENWRINLEANAALQGPADWTQHLQGTKYPTLPLVLPTTYGLIESMAPTMPLTLSFPGETAYELASKDIHPGVLKARTEMYDDFESRWVTNIDPKVKRTYAIATLLHPCFKTYDFIDDFDLIPQSDKAWALSELRFEWATVWKPRPKTLEPPEALEPSADSPKPADVPAATPGADASKAAVEPLTKKRKVTLGSLLGGRVKKEPAPEAQKEPELDELEQYLADPEDPELNIKVLAWWAAKESKWPNLAKMVKQYFAAPASSAGVERVFSAAGKMHDDLKKSAKDDTLEHSILAAFNCD